MENDLCDTPIIHSGDPNFHALSIDTKFLEEPVETWDQNPAYKKFETFVEQLPITNDISKRLIRRTVVYANYGGKSEEDFQATLLTVGDAIATVPKCDTKAALIAAYKKTEWVGPILPIGNLFFFPTVLAVIAAMVQYFTFIYTLLIFTELLNQWLKNVQF